MTPSAPRASPALVVAILAAFPLGLAAQGPAEATASTGARVHVEVGPRYSSVRSEGGLFLGGVARFDFGGPFTFGGAGWVLTDPVELPGGEPGTGLGLKVSYAGVLTGWELIRSGRLRGEARVLWGAGNAKLELPVVETEIAADNFLVVEPGVSADLLLIGPLHVSGALSYRWATGVEDLPGVSTGHLRGLSVSLGLAIGPF